MKKYDKPQCKVLHVGTGSLMLSVSFDNGEVTDETTDHFNSKRRHYDNEFEEDWE